MNNQEHSIFQILSGDHKKLPQNVKKFRMQASCNALVQTSTCTVLDFGGILVQGPHFTDEVHVQMKI